ncbi:hypothetical protein Bca4012_019112 [Brassica carinata]
MGSYLAREYLSRATVGLMQSSQSLWNKSKFPMVLPQQMKMRVKIYYVQSFIWLILLGQNVQNEPKPTGCA